VEFVSERARSLGLPALPVFESAAADAHPLRLCTGRTLTHFHAFYDRGRALPSLARADPDPRLWISPEDAASRGIVEGDGIRIFNERGEMRASAQVTDRIRAGTVWIRDGWADLNTLTSGVSVLPDRAVDLFGFSGGQADFEANVEITRSSTTT
jgi:anaerobic selenocysteine-containing dehydrogenase